MKEIEPYLIEFREDDTIKDKNHLLNYAVEGENCWPIIVIIYDECTFLANDDI